MNYQELDEEINRRISSAIWHQINGFPIFAGTNITEGYSTLVAYGNEFLPGMGTVLKKESTEEKRRLKILADKLDDTVNVLAELK